ncbi:hypothetical protein Tco_1289643 [Tanacetum coccineum]
MNPLIKNYAKRNKQGTVEYHVQPVKNASLKWRELLSMERHAYCERLYRLQGKGFGTPRVADWNLFYSYNFEETLRNKMKFEYIHSDGNVFVDYSWERALSISGDVYPEWLFGIEKVLTLPEFTVLLGLYKEEELNHHLFDIHFTRLEVDDKLFNHEAFWQKIRTPTSTNPRTSLIKEPLMSIVHRLLVGSLAHRAGLKENSLICVGHYVTKIASLLGYLMDEEVMKCSEPIESSIVPSLCYEIGGSSAGFHGDNDFDPIVHSDDCVASDNGDDDMRD